MRGATWSFGPDSAGQVPELRRAPGSTTLHRAEGGNLPVRGRCSRGSTCPHSARQTRECTPPCPSLRAYCPREPLPSASLCTRSTAQSASGGPVRSGWLLAIAAGALRMPPHPAGGLPSPTASAECVARDRTGCLPAASHTRAHSRFLTRGSSPRALCLEVADHPGRDPLELFELRSLVPVSCPRGHRVDDRVTRARVEACRGPLLYSGLCTGARGI